MMALLTALQHGDSAFPSGSFAFSNGIEGLAALGATLDAATLGGVLAGMLRHRWATCERVAVVSARRAGAALPDLAALDAAFEAATLSEPMRLGSQRNGAALLTTHARLGTPGAEALRAAVHGGAMLGHLPVVQGALWAGLGLGEDECAALSGYTSASAMLTAAIRLGLIGAVAAQGVLTGLLGLIAELCARPIPPGTGFTSSAHWLEIAGMRHGEDGLRLFSN
jgi:urease accessory protein